MPRFVLTDNFSDGVNNYSDTQIVIDDSGEAIVFAAAQGNAIAANATNYEIVLPLPKTPIKVIRIFTNQPISIYTNAASSGSPDQTWTIAAAGHFRWTDVDVTGINPVTTDIAAIYVTNHNASQTLDLAIFPLSHNGA